MSEFKATIAFIFLIISSSVSAKDSPFIVLDKDSSFHGSGNTWDHNNHCPIEMDGKCFDVPSGSRVDIDKGQILVDGKPFKDFPHPSVVNVIVHGNVGYIKDVETATVNGSVESVSTTNGDISTGDVSGNISTINGDVKAKAVAGGCTTVNGNCAVKP